MCRRLRSRLWVRSLEERTVPALFTVTNLNDSGADSLRDCVSKANAAAGADTIIFNAGLTGTITLTSGEIALNDAVSITGPGAALLTVSGNNASRIFNTTGAIANAAIELSHMTLTQGRTALFDGGGAILSFDEILTVKACAITNCLASLGVFGGGAIATRSGGKLVMEDTTVSGNVSFNDGGAIHASNGSSVTIRRSTISDNIASASSGACQFGGVGSFVLENCTLSGNTALANENTYQYDGGGAISVFGTPTELLFRNCTLSGNSTSVDGGGVLLGIGKSTAVFQNCTLTNNRAKINGEALALYSNTGTLSFTSTIVAGNPTVTGEIFCHVQTFIAGGGNNLIGVADVGNFTMTGNGNLTGTKAAPLDAKLGPLANNGGPTKTHMLLTNSPALNKGSNPAGLSTDQRGPGYLRVFNTAADIGAVEFQPPPLVVLNTNDSGAGSLRQAVLDANAVVGLEAITFDPAVFATPQTITLTSGEISINDQVSINGPGASVLTISGNNASRIFNIANVATGGLVLLSDLTLTKGRTTGINFGGAINGDNQTLEAQRCTFSNNFAASGGAVQLSDVGVFTAIDCTFSANSTSALGNGGAIGMSGTTSKLVLDGCTFTGNSAPRGGAISATVNLQVIDSTFFGNTATTGEGGAIQAFGTFAAGKFRIVNTTISGNTAGTGSSGDGGGIGLRNFYSGTLELFNCTVTGNSAQVAGGGISRDATSTGSITIESSIVSGNTCAASPDISSKGTVNLKTSAIGSTLGFSMTNLGGNLAFGTNLKLGPLQNNGGPTLTHLPANDSPLIDDGSNPTALTTDQRGTGFLRVIGMTSDIGAVEVLNLVVTNTNDSGVGSLRQTILHANSHPGPDTITFDAAFFSVPRTITLTSGEMAISDAVTINGPGAALATISGNNASRIFNTSSAAKGAAISFSGLTLTQGKTTSNENGGAISSQDQALTLTDCVIIGNSATRGGAIYVSFGALTLQRCIVSSNSSNLGGAIFFFFQSTLTVQSCTIADNTAVVLGGGIMFQLDGTFSILDSTLSGNSIGQSGGALFFARTATDPLLIRNSTFSGNTAAGFGGGICFSTDFSGVLTVQNSTFTGNKAGLDGGGIGEFGSASSITMESTIVSGNSAGSNGPDLSFDSTTLIAGNNNLIGVADSGNFGLTGSLNLTGTKASPLDAKLAPLVNNGGPTMTHALLSGSPAINAGNNSAMLTNDQRGAGFIRSAGGTDIGAFEVQNLPAKISSVQINDGSAQRSRVTSLLITFDQPPSLPGTPASAFQLKRQSDNAVVTLSAAPSGNAVTLTFTGGPVDFGSLADGRYTLTALASQITNLDGDGNGTIGDDFGLIGDPATAPKLFRLFGDENGDGTVAASDFIQFRLALGGSSPVFDFDNDGAVSASDFIQFRLRFGGSV